MRLETAAGFSITYGDASASESEVVYDFGDGCMSGIYGREQDDFGLKAIGFYYR